jgi:hypothetical protein
MSGFWGFGCGVRGVYHEGHAVVVAHDLPDVEFGTGGIDVAAFVEEVFDGFVTGEDDHAFCSQHEGEYRSIHNISSFYSSYYYMKIL